jgi:hypothetical protein
MKFEIGSKVVRKSDKRPNPTVGTVERYTAEAYDYYKVKWDLSAEEITGAKRIRTEITGSRLKAYTGSEVENVPSN